MGSFIRLPAHALGRRIDAEYYRPEYVANAERLAVAPIGRAEFHTLVTEGRRTLYFGTNTLDEGQAPDDWVPFLTADDLGEDGFFVETHSRRRVPPSFLSEYPAGRLRSGELLVKVKGPNQTTAYVDVVPVYPVLVSGTIWGGLVRKDIVDPHYLVAALSSPYAATARTRLRTNLNVEFLSADDLLTLTLPTPARLAQRYIGDKVRWAERMRACAIAAKDAANKIFNTALEWDPILASPLRSRKISAATLGKRLDANFNSPSRLRLADHLSSKRVTTEELDELVEVSAMIGWKGLTTENYVKDGPWLLRGVEIDDGVIRFDNLVCVEQSKYDEQPQIHLKEGDVAMTKDGTIGKAIVVPYLQRPMAAGSTVARLRIKEQSGLSPYYLEHAINHSIGQIQIASFATGMAQPHITQEWIVRLHIPRLPIEQEIGQLVQRHHVLIFCADALVRTAKLLVERLIEGLVSEGDLVAAQKALESGDRSADRAILQTLYRSEAQDAPAFFPNIDAVYDLLDGEEDGGGRN